VTRARYPDQTGYVERGGVRVFWERYGDGEPTVLFLPTWTIFPSRCWKAQIPYFARHYRVLTFDPRGTAGPIGHDCPMRTQSSSSQPTRSR
jgi:pimeloyl-ACP methyl ester carboxylesterase